MEIKEVAQNKDSLKAVVKVAIISALKIVFCHVVTVFVCKLDYEIILFFPLHTNWLECLFSTSLCGCIVYLFLVIMCLIVASPHQLGQFISSNANFSLWNTHCELHMFESVSSLKTTTIVCYMYYATLLYYNHLLSMWHFLLFMTS